ncbi:hypothetical protein BD769DRAFT_1003031 [Suillus cothurnatus]|nr:hypothetical protein BD769DRAFT_1003031 [Suillus cothurnatus]
MHALSVLPKYMSIAAFTALSYTLWCETKDSRHPGRMHLSMKYYIPLCPFRQSWSADTSGALVAAANHSDRLSEVELYL